MPNGDYLPSREPELLNWSQNLYYKLTTSPAEYGVTADQVVPFAAAQEAFKAAYAATTNPTTRTKPTIQEKKTKKKAMIGAIRPLVSAIQVSPVMTDAKRDELEVTVRDNQPTPIGPPEEMPVLRVAAVSGNLLDLELRRPDGETKRRPAGARSAFLYTHLGDAPSADLKQWRFEGDSTKSNPQILLPPSVLPNTQVWVTALWVSPTGQPGPACAPVQTYTNRTGLSQAA